MNPPKKNPQLPVKVSWAETSVAWQVTNNKHWCHPDLIDIDIDKQERSYLQYAFPGEKYQFFKQKCSKSAQKKKEQ